MLEWPLFLQSNPDLCGVTIPRTPQHAGVAPHFPLSMTTSRQDSTWSANYNLTKRASSARIAFLDLNALWSCALGDCNFEMFDRRLGFVMTIGKGRLGW